MFIIKVIFFPAHLELEKKTLIMEKKMERPLKRLAPTTLPELRHDTSPEEILNLLSDPSINLSPKDYTPSVGRYLWPH